MALSDNYDQQRTLPEVMHGEAGLLQEDIHTHSVRETSRKHGWSIRRASAS